MEDTLSGGDYAGMTFVRLWMWIGLALLAGVLSRKLLRAPKMLGLFGDMASGLLGAFGLGWVLRQLDVDLSEYILTWSANITVEAAIWVDVALVAFFGALILRFILRPLAETNERK